MSAPPTLPENEVDRPKGNGMLVVLTGMAVGALLARRADGSSIISIGLLLLIQGPGDDALVHQGLLSPGSSRQNRRGTSQPVG